MKSLFPKLVNLFSFICLFAGLFFLLQEGEGGCGDRPQHFRVVYWGMALGASLGILFLIFQNNNIRSKRIWYLVQIGIRYYLGYTIITYGIAKVLDIQFATMGISLDSKIIELTPMQVAWSFFGYSFVYSAFVGWSQIISGVLLFFRKTAVFGAIVLFTIMLNIVLVNFCFDVCVKLNSSVLLAMCLCVLLWSSQRLWTAIFTDQSVPQQTFTPLFSSPRVNRMMLWIRNILVIAMLIYSFNEAKKIKQQYQIGVETPVKGVWELNAMEWNTADSTQQTTPFDKVDQLFFEHANMLFTKTKGNPQMNRYTYELKEEVDSIYINSMTDSTRYKGSFQRINKDSLDMVLETQGDTLRWNLRRLNQYDLR